MKIEGTWTLERRDSKAFDAFLTCRKVSYLMRSILTTFKADIEYSVDNESVLIKKTITSLGTKTYRMPYPSGEFTPVKTLSGKDEFGKIKCRNDGFRQEMFLRSERLVEPLAVIEKRVNSEDKLIVTLKCKDVECVEIYKRV